MRRMTVVLRTAWWLASTLVFVTGTAAAAKHADDTSLVDALQRELGLTRSAAEVQRGMLALDREHRESAAMSRTVAQAMALATAPAGRLLRDQARRMREFLRERRRMIFSTAKEAAKGGVDRLKTASTSRWDRLKESSRLFRSSEE